MSEQSQTYMDLFDKSAKSQAWLELARPAAVHLAKLNGYVTADDVRERVPIPLELDPRVAGALFNDKKTFVCVGYVKSRRKACHNRPIGKFKLRVTYKELA